MSDDTADFNERKNIIDRFRHQHSLVSSHKVKIVNPMMAFSVLCKIKFEGEGERPTVDFKNEKSRDDNH